jgi:hypothetical protein
MVQDQLRDDAHAAHFSNDTVQIAPKAHVKSRKVPCLIGRCCRDVTVRSIRSAASANIADVAADVALAEVLPGLVRVDSWLWLDVRVRVPLRENLAQQVWQVRGARVRDLMIARQQGHPRARGREGGERQRERERETALDAELR